MEFSNSFIKDEHITIKSKTLFENQTQFNKKLVTYTLELLLIQLICEHTL